MVFKLRFKVPSYVLKIKFDFTSCSMLYPWYLSQSLAKHWQLPNFDYNRWLIEKTCPIIFDDPLWKSHNRTTLKSTAYTSLVGPVLEYASPAWDPTSSEGIVKLEKVQRQAARFVHGNYSERDPGCVTRMVSDLGWETLDNRRKKDRLTTLYKIWHGLVDMDTGDVLRLNDRCTRGQQRLYQPMSRSTKTPSFPEPSKTGIASLLQLQTPKPSRSSEPALSNRCRLSDAKWTAVF